MFIRKLRTSVSPFHHLATLALQHAIVDLVTDTERRTAITRRGLNENTLKRAVQQYLSVHYRVVCNAACEPQVSQSSPLVKIAQYVKSDFFETQLQTRSNIALTIRKLRAVGTWWSKQSREFVREHTSDHRRTLLPRHLDTFSMVTEVIEIQTESPVLLGANDLAKLVDEAWPPVRREPHHLSFIAVMWKPEKLCRSGVDNAGRVWILDLAQDLDRISFAHGPHRRDEIAKTVNGQQCGTLKWRDEETTGEMCAMVFDVVKPCAHLFFRHAKHARELILKIAHPRSVAESIFHLTASKTRNARRREQ